MSAIAWNQLCSSLKIANKLKPAQLHVKDLPESAALFVTWTLDGDLRGCIGTFAKGPTEATIRRYADIAAFEDPRFEPIEEDEVPRLSVGVTLLGDLEPCGVHDWVIGKHGVKAVFPGGYDATFLPEVAEEQGWDHAATIKHLAAKAGAPSTKGVKVWRYPGTKTHMSWKEYKALSQA